MQTSLITVEHPAGRVRVKVPTNVRIEELMADFLDVASQPDRDDWALGAAGGPPYPPNLTLAQLGVNEGSMLVLHTSSSPNHASPHARPLPADGAEQPAPVTVNGPAPGSRALSEHDEQALQRPVSARTARTLPARLSITERLAAAGQALVTRTPLRARDARTAGVPDPALFTLPARVSPLARMREAWELSDYERLLEQLIVARHLCRCVSIAVVSPKGGVGKSTTTALLGSLLAYLRRDRVVAVDTNPDWGSLGRRLVPDHPIFIDDLLAGPLNDGRLTPTQLDAQLGRGPDGLMVAPAPTDPDRAGDLNTEAYATLFARLSELVGTLVLDCGTGLDSAAARAALSCADQLVLVADGEPDTASLVAEAARHLERHAPPLVLVANNLNRSSLVDVDALEREIPFARGIARVPTNKPGAQQLHASRFTWTQPPAGWAIPIRQLAALLAADWPRLDIAH
jgi:MinD-like ATPase involved in chromosome partitioning or flagellar assembly